VCKKIEVGAPMPGENRTPLPDYVGAWGGPPVCRWTLDIVVADPLLSPSDRAL